MVMLKRIGRAKMFEFFGELSPCLAGIEACPSAHHWGRETAANCAREGVSHRVEARILRRRTRCIAAECSRYNLNHEIEMCCRYMSHPCPQATPICSDSGTVQRFFHTISMIAVAA
jgi:hypothetical protein